MKKSILFSALCLAFLCSCDDDDEPTRIDRSQLIGEWQLVNLDYDGSSSTSFPGLPDTEVDFTGSSSNEDYILSFDESPDTYTGMGSYDATVESDGQTNTVNVEVSRATGEWDLDGSTLTLSTGIISYAADGSSATELTEPSTITVKELSDTRMVLEQTTSETESVLGFEVTTSATGTMEFSKN